MPTFDESVKCRGVNGTIALVERQFQITGGSLGSIQSREIPFEGVSAVVVERKSVIPLVIAIALALVVIVLLDYNVIWFLVDLSRAEAFITAVGLLIVTLCVIIIVLRTVFVNVSIRVADEGGVLMFRFVPTRCARRFARQFRERSGGG